MIITCAQHVTKEWFMSNFPQGLIFVFIWKRKRIRTIYAPVCAVHLVANVEDEQVLATSLVSDGLVN